MGCGTKCPLSHLEEVFLIGRRRCVNPQIAKHPRLLWEGSGFQGTGRQGQTGVWPSLEREKKRQGERGEGEDRREEREKRRFRTEQRAAGLDGSSPSPWSNGQPLCKRDSTTPVLMDEA